MNDGFIELMNGVKKNSEAIRVLREKTPFLPLLSIPRTVTVSDLNWIVGFTPVMLYDVIRGKVLLDPTAKYVFVCGHKSDDGDYDEKNPVHNPYQTYLDDEFLVPTPRSLEFRNDIFHRLLADGTLISIRDKFHRTGEYLTREEYQQRLEQGNSFQEES